MYEINTYDALAVFFLIMPFNIRADLLAFIGKKIPPKSEKPSLVGIVNITNFNYSIRWTPTSVTWPLATFIFSMVTIGNPEAISGVRVTVYVPAGIPFN